MLKPFIKLLCFGLLALTLSMTGCGTDDDEPGAETATTKITPEEVQAAMHLEGCFYFHHAQEIDEQGILTDIFRIEPGHLKVKGHALIITKVELYINGELYSTKYNNSDNSAILAFQITQEPNTPKNNYKIHIYGCTCPENETYIII